MIINKIGLLVLAVLLIFLLWKGVRMFAKGSVAKQINKEDIFISPLSQMGWYSNDQDSLLKELNSYLDKATQEKLKDIQALVLPHAGYRYSGQVAAAGIRQIIGKKYKRVIIIGPSHHVYMKNTASVPDVKWYQTPLGKVKLDNIFIEKLLNHREFSAIHQAHHNEHSVQIEIPFVQMALKGVKVVPIVVGNLDKLALARMAEILLSLMDDQTLVIVSSDFVHYGKRFAYVPFSVDIAHNLKKIDFGAYKYIEKKDAQGFINYCDKTGATICGRHAIALLLEMLAADTKSVMLDYQTSGSLTNDWQNSVSYMSVAFTGKWSKIKGRKKMGRANTLTNKEKKALLNLARKTVAYYLQKGKVPEPEELDIKITKNMQQIMGAFVTLKKHGQLRGCIGEIFPRRSLFEAVIHQAINAAVNDYRFSNVQEHELAEIEFEISALTEPRAIDSYQDIVLGKHGIVLRKLGRSAVFLPQVAPEQGWNLEQTLTHLSQKAGLSLDAWKNNADFLVFEAIVFSEEL
jgi:AmmeMemoRadiSam system protein B/AmmeMemoRadiSam system protein A